MKKDKLLHDNRVDIKNLLNPNKFIPVYLSRHQLSPLSLPPFSVELHLTSICNYDCYHCSYSKRNMANEYLKDSYIEGLIDDLTSDLKPDSVYFSGGGEPTTLKNWDIYVNKLIDNEVEVSLITNGSLFNDNDIETLSRLSYLAVSIYSTNRETYGEITEGKNFDSSFSLPRKIKDISNRPTVGARCVINKFNYREVIDIYNKAIDSSYDYVIFIPEIDYEKSGITLKAHEIDYLSELASKANVDSRRTNLLDLVNRKFEYYRSYGDFYKGINCQAIELRTNAFVNYDGGVYLCQPHIGNSRYCIGNIYDKRLSDIWNSDGHVKVIDLLSAEWANGRCENCRSIKFNKSVNDYLSLDYNQPIDIVKDPFI